MPPDAVTGHKPLGIDGVIAWSPLNTRVVAAGNVPRRSLRPALKLMMSSWKAGRFTRPNFTCEATGRVQVAARTPRRNVRRARAQARAPGSKDPPNPPLETVPLARFRRDVRRWQEGAV